MDRSELESPADVSSRELYREKSGASGKRKTGADRAIGATKREN